MNNIPNLLFVKRTNIYVFFTKSKFLKKFAINKQ